jgi:hypothetical protein
VFKPDWAQPLDTSPSKLFGGDWKAPRTFALAERSQTPSRQVQEDAAVRLGWSSHATNLGVYGARRLRRRLRREG